LYQHFSVSCKQEVKKYCFQNWKRRAKRLAVKGPPGSNLASMLNTESGKYKNPPSKSKFINKLGGRTQQQHASGGAASRQVTGTVQQQQQTVLQLTTPSGGNVTVSPHTPTDSKYGIHAVIDDLIYTYRKVPT